MSTGVSVVYALFDSPKGPDRSRSKGDENRGNTRIRPGSRGYRIWCNRQMQEKSKGRYRGSRT